MLFQIRHSRTEIYEDWKHAAIEYLKPNIRYYALRYQDDMTFDDIYQELSLHLWNKLDKFNPEGTAKLEGWASKVMRLRIIDLWRMNNKEERTKLRKSKKK